MLLQCHPPLLLPLPLLLIAGGPLLGCGGAGDDKAVGCLLPYVHHVAWLEAHQLRPLAESTLRQGPGAAGRRKCAPLPAQSQPPQHSSSGLAQPNSGSTGQQSSDFCPCLLRTERLPLRPAISWQWTGRSSNSSICRGCLPQGAPPCCRHRAAGRAGQWEGRSCPQETLHAGRRCSNAGQGSPRLQRQALQHRRPNVFVQRGRAVQCGGGMGCGTDQARKICGLWTCSSSRLPQQSSCHSRAPPPPQPGQLPGCPVHLPPTARLELRRPFHSLEAAPRQLPRCRLQLQQTPHPHPPLPLPPLPPSPTPLPPSLPPPPCWICRWQQQMPGHGPPPGAAHALLAPPAPLNPAPSLHRVAALLSQAPSWRPRCWRQLRRCSLLRHSCCCSRRCSRAPCCCRCPHCAAVRAWLRVQPCLAQVPRRGAPC